MAWLTQKLPSTTQVWAFLKSSFHPNFYRLHLAYFLLVTLVSSAILWAANTTDYHVKYIDSLFLCLSCLCNVGLNTVNLGLLNGYQQSVLLVLMLLGDLTLVSISVVIVRRYLFGKKIKDFLAHSKEGRRMAAEIKCEEQGDEPQSIDFSRSNGRESDGGFPRSRRVQQVNSKTRDDHEQDEAQRLLSNDHGGHHKASHTAGYGGFPAPWDTDLYKRTFGNNRRSKPRQTRNHIYLSFKPTLDHHGRFRDLTAEQEQELGGVEYRALKLLTWFLPAYAFFWLLLVMVVMTPYVVRTNVGNVIRTSQPGDLNPAWWSVFTTISAYTNTGMNLMDQNMIPVANNYLILIFTGMAVLVGNTLYPVFLRLGIWALGRLIPKHSELHHSVAFLLHHPRRCYLFLFPAKNTWYLFVIQVGINLLAWVFWIILQFNYGPVDPGMPPGQRVMDGLYQAHGLRASGFYIITISSIAPALQLFYLVVMYISAFPIIMSLRSTNIYEERSLGQDDDTARDYLERSKDKASPPKSQLGQHIRQQLAYDLWWLILAIFLVCVIERDSLTAPAPGWSTFSVFFECVSAYGTVGLSLGVPYDDYSFCGTWHSLSKVVLMTVMLRGRHRILPMAIDRAVLLPGQELMEKLDREHGQQGDDVTKKDKATEANIRNMERGAQAEDSDRHQGVQDPEREKGDGEVNDEKSGKRDCEESSNGNAT